MLLLVTYGSLKIGTNISKTEIFAKFHLKIILSTCHA